MENTNQHDDPGIQVLGEQHSDIPQVSPTDQGKVNGVRSVVIGLALILFGILLGVLASKYIPIKFTSQTPNPTPTPSLSITPTPSSVVEETPGYKNLEFPKEYLSLKYPQDWSIKIESKDIGGIYSLTSPNKFTLTFWLGADGLGGACFEDCQIHNVKNSVIDVLNFYSTPLYIVVNGLSDNVIGKATIGFNVIPEKSCWNNICYGFKSKRDFGEIIIKGTNPAYVSTDTFVKSPDVITAVNILKSIKYSPPSNADYACPVSGWIDCMPILDAAKTIACSADAMAWYKDNCTNFQGAAL